MKGFAKSLLSEIGQVMFGYDATVDKGRRAAPSTITMSEDDQLNPWSRKKAVATQRDQVRNLPWVAWMARTHINYVSHFSFRATTDDEDLNLKLDQLMHAWSEPENCDIAKRHSLGEMMALFEAGQVIDGDCGLKKAGTALQGIESDRICKPNSGKIPKGLTDHGLLLRKNGSVKSYAVCNRSMSGMSLQGMVPEKDMFFAGYFKRFDQTRGISPLLTALNTNQDVYENFEYALIKMKMHAMLGLQVTRAMPSSGDDGWGGYDKVEGTTAGGNAKTEYVFEHHPAMKIEMDPGDKIETIESRTPSDEFQSFTQFEMRVSLLALDIPFSIFDSDRSNNNAMRVDFRQYFDSARKKQGKNKRVLNDITKWKLQQWLVDGSLTVDEFNRAKWLWQPSGIPIFDPRTEIAAFATEISNGLNSRTNIARERGLDQREIFADLKREEDAIGDLGLKGITIGQPGQVAIGAQEEKADIEREEVEQEAKPEQAFEEGEYYNDDGGELYQFLNGKLHRQ
jgi:capsid protein